MPALCWHHKTTYCAQNNASKLCLSVAMAESTQQMETYS